ncbi:hypothetical protein BGW41_006764 [Actinomortierella wolfii]|nr:hypothetical protein BGW41_006764 [Actinomortierella wolfii]
MEAPQVPPNTERRRSSLTEKVSHLVHRVTHPHRHHHENDGSESHSHPQHAKQNVQEPPHQYGGPDNEHDLAYEAEATLPGAHAIPPFGFSWINKKLHPHQKAKDETPATTTGGAADNNTTTAVEGGGGGGGEATTLSADAIAPLPSSSVEPSAPEQTIMPEATQPTHPFDNEPITASSQPEVLVGEHQR